MGRQIELEPDFGEDKLKRTLHMPTTENLVARGPDFTHARKPEAKLPDSFRPVFASSSKTNSQTPSDSSGEPGRQLPTSREGIIRRIFGERAVIPLAFAFAIAGVWSTAQKVG